MKRGMIEKVFYGLRRKISVLLIVCLIMPHININPSYAFDLQYSYVPELEIDESMIDDGMFYLPHNNFHVNEKDSKVKYVFKVVRKGGAEKSEKVKLTMVDITGKYDRDYSIKVIDKLVSSENVQNRYISKSIDEYMRENKPEEYNFSDAVVDGTILADDIMSDEEKENYVMSDEEKDNLVNNAKEILEEYGVEGEFEKVEPKDIEEKNNETVLEEEAEEDEETVKTEDENEESIENTDAPDLVESTKETETEVENEIKASEEIINKDNDELDNNIAEANDVIVEVNNENLENSETVSGFTGTDTLEEKNVTTETSEALKEEETTKEKTKLEETNEEDLTVENESSKESTIEESKTNDNENNEEESDLEETSKEETLAKESSEEETTLLDQSKESTNSEEVTDTTLVSDNNEETTESTIVDGSDSASKVATASLVEYGEEVVDFDILHSTVSTISMKEAYERLTGEKSDRKYVKPDRNFNNYMPDMKSADDYAYMQDSIKEVQEELKSAYVILEFKEGQTEKLIEISVINDVKYRGTRQVGFDISSVDGSQISGAYASLTLEIEDDEDVEPSYINFVESNFTPNDGYITVTIERSGEVAGIATCMIDTEDITAKGGRDYSKVHAELVFGFGINVRTVKIPIVSRYIKDSASFKLKLQEAKGALIGETGTAICTIRKSDKDFEYAGVKREDKESGKKLFGSNNIDTELSELKEETSVNNKDLYGAGGRDYDLDSMMYGDPIDLTKSLKNFKSKKANSSSNHYFIEDGKGYHMYLENKSVNGQSAYYEFDIDTAELGYRYDTVGLQFEWSINHNADVELEEYMPDGSKRRFLKKEDWGWSGTDKDDYYLENERFTKFNFWLRREGGCWGKSPTVNIYAIRPILKMYKINLFGSDVPELVNDDGISTSANKYAKYAITSIEGCKSDHTAVGWTGKTITVKLDNTVNNPFYIKNLWIRTAATGGSWNLLARNFDSEATTISFKMDEKFHEKYMDFITPINRPSGKGKNGEFNIYAELGVKSSLIKVEKDERVDVKIWNRSAHENGTDTDSWWYNVGDVLHFNAEVKPEYSEVFECNGLNVYRIKPYSPDWITIRKPLTGDNYFPLDCEYSEIKVVPVLSKKDNTISIRVPKDKINLFDTSYGIFTNTSYETDDYYEYFVDTDSSNIAGNYFDLKAKTLSDNDVPVWYENNKESIKYTQNTYYFLGSLEPDDNIIYLTCEEADDRKYSIGGIAYYEEATIGGKTVDRYWQVAPYVGVVVDDYHYGYADKDGEFITIPGQGKAGYYKKIKIVSNSYDRYKNVELTKDNPKTNTFVIDYQDGQSTLTQDIYYVDAGEVLISNITKDHPYITGVKSTNMAGTSFGAVYINDNVTILTASVSPKKADGSDYTYTYVEEDGREVVAVESVKRVEFAVVDMATHAIKKIIEATKSNADKTEWTASYGFERGNYSEYMSGDKLYARIVTDRKLGDGKGEDIEGSGVRKEIPIFNETTYQAIPTTLPFIEEAAKEPFIVNIDLPDDPVPIEMPLIGGLSTMLNMAGMSFGITTEGDRVRLYLGKKFNVKGRYDEDGNTKEDNDHTDISLKNFGSEMKAMTDLINQNGKERGYKKLKTMTLGLSVFTFEPIVGIYFEFMISYNADSVVTSQYEFSAGGGYFGGILDFKFTFYFLVYGIPCYLGGDINLQLAAELGFAVDDGKRIPFNDPDQRFFDSLLSNIHFDFLIRATLVTTAYAGVGIAGALGVRGGFQLTFKFVWNPAIRKKYASVRPVGFAITGAIRLWADIGFMSIPIPLYTWREPLQLGYFKDIDELYHKHTGDGGLLGAAESTIDNELKTSPRFKTESKFVANDKKESGLFGGTYVEDNSNPIIEGVYDRSEPKLVEYANSIGRICKELLVYLDDDSDQSDLDRTTLKYTIYDMDTKQWKPAKKVWEESNTADFSPVLYRITPQKVLLAWAKRPDPVDEDTEKADLLKKMEIYTAIFDGETGEFETPVRMTYDDSYDYYPQIAKSSTTNQLYLYYLKNDNVTDINDADDLLNNVQPETNGAHLVYLLYGDADDGRGERWLTDFYYDSELPSDVTTEEEKADFIASMKGQRLKDLSIDIGGDTPRINDPNISDYVTSTTNALVATDEEWEVYNQLVEDFNDNGKTWDLFLKIMEWEYYHRNEYNVCAYVVDDDGNPNTTNDTELYVKYKIASESETQTIRLTHNAAPDTMPKMLEVENDTYLFWIQNETAIKMIGLKDLIKEAHDEDHASKQIDIGEINIKTADNIIMGDKINNFVPFTDSSNNNIFLVWQQDSSGEVGDLDESGEIEFKQDLYVAGLVETEVDGEEIQTWTNPVRFTNNGKVNDLPAVYDLRGSIQFINNQYNLKSSGDSYSITNSNLQETIFAKKSSLYITSVINSIEEEMEDGNKRYKTMVNLKNTGLYAAKGFTYSGSIKYDGRTLSSFNGSSDEVVLPGNETRIGVSYDETSGETATIYFTLSEEQQKHLDKVMVDLTVTENETYDTGSLSSKEVFDVKEEFTFVKQDDSEEEKYTNVTVEQVGDNFVVKGILKNTGNTDAIGNEKICVIDQLEWDTVIASSDYLHLAMGEQVQFEIPVDSSLIQNLERGVRDLAVYVSNDDGKVLSYYEIATANARQPFGFKVNGGADQIQIKAGDAIDLTTTYIPNRKYKNATILYSVSDGDIAKTSDNKLYGLNEGTTTLSLTTKEFGGTKDVEIIVLPNVAPTPVPSGGSQYDGGGGGSGGGPGGGGKGGGMAGGGNSSPTVTELSTSKITTPTVNYTDASWSFDPISNKFSLKINMLGQQVPAQNVFVTLNEAETYQADGVQMVRMSQNTYYFDSNGNMTTGWVKTADNNWYFFENEKTVNEGRMVTGWKQIEGNWYYFDSNGVMLVNTVTPDGYKLGIDGKMISKDL